MSDQRTATHDIALLAAPFIFLRHGETTSNRDAVIAGSLDVELTDTGRAQAIATGQRLATLGLTLGPFISSSRRRARDTAALVLASLGRDQQSVRVVQDLDERCWGALEGRPREERRYCALPPDVETSAAFSERIRRGLAMIPPAEGQRAPVIVAHSGTWRMLCQLIGVTATAAPIGNALPVRVAPGGGGWTTEDL